MLCEYRFEVLGLLRLNETRPIPLNGRMYDLKVDETTGQVTSLVVRVPANDKRDWPTITELRPIEGDPNSPKAHVTLRSPNLEEVLDDVQSIESILSIQGVDRINVDEVDVRFLPETDDEKELIPIPSFKTGFGEPDIKTFERNEFDVVARSIMAVPELKRLRTPMSFFRKGNIDLKARRYIDAFYDYFFVIETLFANGKSRTLAMKEAFANSELLLRAAKSTIHEALRSNPRWSPSDIRRLRERYMHNDIVDTLSALIETRGYLHHHASRRPDTWDPNQEAVFKVDSSLLQMISFKVLWAQIHEPIFSKRAVDRYVNTFVKTAP